MIGAGLVDGAARWSARLGGATILLSALLVSAEVIARNLGLGIRLHAFELTNYAFAAAVAFGLSFAATQRAHIRIDVAYQFLPVSLRALLDLLAMALLTVMATGMAWYAWKVVRKSLALGARPNSTLDIPLAIPQSFWAIGLSWFALVSFLLTLQALMQLARRDLQALHESAGVGSETPTGETR